MAMQVDGVVGMEGWQFVSGELLDVNGEVLENINIFGPPADSVLIEPLLVKGRWIHADDVRKLALSEAAYGYFPNIKPGDQVTLKIDGREEDWEVIGIFKFVDREGVLAYAPYEYISQMNNLANRSYSFREHRKPRRTYQNAGGELISSSASGVQCAWRRRDALRWIRRWRVWIRWWYSCSLWRF